MPEPEKTYWGAKIRSAFHNAENIEESWGAKEVKFRLRGGDKLTFTHEQLDTAKRILGTNEISLNISASGYAADDDDRRHGTTGVVTTITIEIVAQKVKFPE